MKNEKQKAQELRLAEINIGDTHEFHKTITHDDIARFASLTGDYNPLHTDLKFAQMTPFRNNIAHGMLVGSLFSTLVGMYCPGKNNLYLKQSLNFVEPVFPGDQVCVKGVIESKSEALRVVHIKTEVLRDGKPVVTGKALVRVLETK